MPRAGRTAAIVFVGVACRLTAGPAPALAQSELRVGIHGPFVAAGDGLTDDTAAIQAALNAVLPGGTVTVDPGRTYLINLSVGLRPKSQCRLNLHGAILRGPAGQGGRFIDLTSKTNV